MLSAIRFLRGLGPVLALLCAGCNRTPKPTDQATPLTVKAATAKSVTTIEKEFVGLSTPDDAVNLAFKIGGQVVDIPVSKGRAVEQGELIARLDERDVELQVEADRTAWEEARSQLERMKRLLAHEAISQQEYERANTTYARARSTYENSRSLLSDTKIRAPFSGVIEATYVDAYQRVASGEPIARLVKPLTLTVTFTAPEQSIYSLSEPSTRFTVLFDNYPGIEFSARLKNYARTSVNASGFPTSLTLIDPDTVRYPIAPGMSCTILMRLQEPIEGVVAVPLSAIRAPAAGGTEVWVIDSLGRVELRKVTLGNPVGDSEIAVLSGLKAGERVVTAGVYRLKEGDRVRILNLENTATQ